MRVLIRKPWILLGAIALISAISILALSRPNGHFMSVEEAKKKWGDVEFSAEKFKAGDSNVRASMAASIISKKTLVGTPLADIRNELGSYTGYYFSDMIPAYAIGDLSHGRKETWQIILIPDHDSKVIEEIKIHKKCCDK